MARVEKIDNAILKRRRRKEERNKRNENFKEEREYFLLFCEGERTEPNYFLSIAKSLPKNTVKIEIDPKGGLNTVSLVNHAINVFPNYKKSNPQIDYNVWIIFDKDSFPNQDFDNAINMAKANGFNTAQSNEAFELWYLLHFEFYNTGISRRQYGNLLSNYIGKKYLKNDPDIYNILNELDNCSEENAIRNARRLIELNNLLPDSQSNPITYVHELVEELNKYREI